MKTRFGLIFLVLPWAVNAQMPQGMDPAQMEKMMQQMQNMASCMEKIDKSAMNTLEQEGKQLEREVNALCQAGKRDDAQQKAVAMSQNIALNPTMQAMKKCGENMKGMTSIIPDIYQDETISGKTGTHVCDP